MNARLRVFRYTASTPAGARVEGQLEAMTSGEAITLLWERGVIPLEAREQQEATSARWWRRGFLSRHRPSQRDIAFFTREFATLTQSGIPLDDALRIVAGHSLATAMRRITGDLLEAVLDGTHLSDAMARHPDAFEGDYVNMVRAGEASGNMGRVFGELSGLLERRLELAGKIRSALVYPAILVVMAAAAVAVVIGVLVPSLAPIFAESGRAMPTMIALIVGLERSWPVLASAAAGIAVVAVVLGVAISRSTAARLVIDRLLLRMPFVGTLNAEYNLARYARTLGSLLQAGVPMLGALTSANSILSNSYMATALAESLNDVRDGQNLGRALSGRPGIPMLALRMISVGEETGRLGDMLLRVAVVTEQQSHSRIERVMTLLTPALTVAVAGFVGALIFTVMNAILSVNELAVQ